MLALDPIELPLRSHALIEASAGTGKTYTITTLFLRLLLERNADVKSILVVTYTKAATAELRNRLRLYLSQTLRALQGEACDDETICRYLAARARTTSPQSDAPKLRGALADFDQAAVFTMHGFCDRILRENAFSMHSGFDNQILEDTRPLVRQIAEDYIARELQSQPPLVARYLRKKDPDTSFFPRLFGWTRSAHAHVIPEARAHDLDSAIADWKAEKAAALRSWSKDPNGLAELLLRDPGLNRRSYGAGRLEKWLATIETELRREDRLVGNWVEHLSKSGIDKGTKKKFTPPTHAFFDACEGLRHADERLHRELEAWHIDFQQRFLSHARDELARRGETGSFVTFDDLLERVDDALTGDSGATLAHSIRDAYPFALVDEFQDTDPVQHAILNRIYREGGQLFMIGDPKQAIYGFRGADVFSYLRATREEDLVKRTLTTNWRSDPRLIDATNRLFNQSEQPFALNEIHFRQAVPSDPSAENRFDTPFELLWWDDRSPDKPLISKIDADRRIPELIAHDIKRTLSETSSPDEIAVLCRTNAQARAVQRALRALEVPTVLDGDASVFASETAESLEWLLTAAANPGDRGAVRKALAGSIFGHSVEELWAIRNDETESLKWQARFQRWSDLWIAAGLPRFMHAFFGETGLEARLMHRTEGERIWTDLHHLVELLHEATATEHLHSNQAVMWLANMRAGDPQQRMLNWDAVQQRVETDEPAVQLTTIHKSKGLEYPIVYCPFLWGSSGLWGDEKKAVRFHDSSADDQLTIDLGSTDQAAHEELAEREAFAEGLRLVYVALTRAKHRCTVLWSPITDWWKAPLAHYLHPRSAARGHKPEAMLAELQSLAASSEGAIGVRLAGEGALFSEPSPVALKPLQCRSQTRTFELSHRLSSFTAMTAGSFEAHQGAPSAEGLADVLFRRLPAGRRTGAFLHTVLESIDFAAVEPAALANLVDHQLRRFGLATDFAPAVCNGIEKMLQAPLVPHQELSLATIAHDRRLIELEFTLPVQVDTSSPLRGRDIAKAIASEVPTDYAATLSELSFAPLVGYLRGFVDLVFEWQGRWFLADYKSNRLSSYDADSLVDTMKEHHYFLQYHLYTLALHRYLASRVPDYDYDTHFGGVFYLFLRGMSGESTEEGIFFRRPSAASVDALDTLFGERRGGDG